MPPHDHDPSPRAAQDIPAGVLSPVDDLAHAPVLASERRVTAANIALVLLSVLMAAVGQLLLRHGMQGAQLGVDRGHGSLITNALHAKSLYAGLGIFGLSALLWMLALAKVPLSYAYPFNGIGFVLILLVSRFRLHEHVSVARWVGAAIVFAGIVLIVSGETPDTKPAQQHASHATARR
jgi:drug/metabolite transporter (DMT)-like permease